MSEAKHAPTPWIIDGCSGRMITTPGGYYGFIADVDTKANAAFIVRAVNNHERLVEALEAAARFLPSIDSLPNTRTEIGDAAKLAAAALAAAKGES